MFSETTRQVMFVLGAGAIHAIIMFLFILGSMGDHRLKSRWRTVCIVAAVPLHIVLWIVLVTNDNGLSMDQSTITLAVADTTAYLAWRLFDRRHVVRGIGSDVLTKARER